MNAVLLFNANIFVCFNSCLSLSLSLLLSIKSLVIECKVHFSVCLHQENNILAYLMPQIFDQG